MRVPNEPDEVPMKSLRFLIADDDGVTLMVLRKTLTEMGHEVVAEAGDGEQALALAREQKPDIAVLDIRMPGLDGLAVCRAIQGFSAMPIIILSAHSEAGLGSEASKAGADAYLVKPFTAAQLGPAIELALSNKQKLQQMNEALESRKLIERAKGILMRQTGLQEEAAYLKLQKTARNENRKLVDVARAVILADQIQRDNPNITKSPPI
jgi:response regulator NasT